MVDSNVFIGLVNVENFTCPSFFLSFFQTIDYYPEKWETCQWDDLLNTIMIESFVFFFTSPSNTYKTASYVFFVTRVVWMLLQIMFIIHNA